MTYLLFIFLANAGYDEQILKISEMRQNIESLSVKRQSEQKRMNQELESLTARKAELEQQLSRERLKSQILIGKKDINQKINQAQKQSVKDRQWIENWIHDLKYYVESGLPYLVDSRLNQLETLKKRLQQSESHEIIVQDLWKFTENELELTRTNIFELSSLKVANLTETAEVAKLGMLKLFFKTAKGQRGYAKYENDQWALKVIEDKELAAAIDKILVQVQNQKGSIHVSLPKEIL